MWWPAVTPGPPNVCWVGSRQRTAKTPVHYSHYTEVHQPSVYGDTGSCIDTRYKVSEIAKGKSYSYPPTFLSYICVCRDHIWLNFINLLKLALNIWHWTDHRVASLNFAVLYSSIRGVQITGLRISAAYVQRPVFMLLFLKYIVIRDMRLNYCETVRYR